MGCTLHMSPAVRGSCQRCIVFGLSCPDLCAGTMGLKGDLTAGEIVEQLVHAQRVTAIKNVVFMVGLPPFYTRLS